jgi:hypothetical protein
MKIVIANVVLHMHLQIKRPFHLKNIRALIHLQAYHLYRN